MTGRASWLEVERLREDPRRDDPPRPRNAWADESPDRREAKKVAERIHRPVQVNVEDDQPLGGGSEPVEEHAQGVGPSAAPRLSSTVLQALMILVALVAFALAADLLVRWLYEPGLLVRLIAIGVGLLVGALLVRMAFGRLQ